jgi:flagellar motor switch protein FliG
LSDFDLVDFEDLELLDGSDLRAVFDQVPSEQVLDALVGLRPGVRQLLLTKLPASSLQKIQAGLDDHGPVSTDSARDAQRLCVETLCRLSRGGIIAFDHPADIQVA